MQLKVNCKKKFGRLGQKFALMFLEVGIINTT